VGSPAGAVRPGGRHRRTFVEAGAVGQHDQHSIAVAHVKLSQRGGDLGRLVDQLGELIKATLGEGTANQTKCVLYPM
jgi:hypothetical protein